MEQEYKMSSGLLRCFPFYAIFDFTADSYDIDDAKEFLGVLDGHYKKRKCVVISSRKFTKNINPDVYKSGRSKAAVAIAIVSDNDEVREEAVQEQSLYDGAFSFFQNVQDAVNWATTFKLSY